MYMAYMPYVKDTITITISFPQAYSFPNTLGSTQEKYQFDEVHT